jgi:hypothetical protein
MPIWDSFSKRKRRDAGEYPDVYQYGKIPLPLRRQIVHIWITALGHTEYVDNTWKFIHDTAAREFGVFYLGGRHDTHFDQCQQFILNSPDADTDKILDLVELTFLYIDSSVRNNWYPVSNERHISQEPDDAIDELNARFKEHGVGYQYANGKIIRIDSELIHAEVIKPVLQLLTEKRFRGAQDEFLKAHKHYRNGETKDSVVGAQRSFESVMKVIADTRKWAYPPGAPAKKLIEVLLSNGLVPASLQSQFTALASVLESGLPTIRNKTSGHGQGGNIVEVPPYLAAFALHLCAANILFLVEADKANR